MAELTKNEVSILDDVIRDCLKSFSVTSLKKEQREILDCLLCNQHCMAVLPTGFGKSLPYQIYQAVERRMHEVKRTDYLDRKIIVCSPLIALMEDQVKRLDGKNNIKAVFIGGIEYTDYSTFADTDLLFASPETLLGNSDCRAFLKTITVGVIVIDEFHTIATWGGNEEDREEDVFRKWFRCIGELRSIYPDSTVIALSATCTMAIRKRVMKVLNLSRNSTRIISFSPNRSNIKLVVKKIPNTIEEAFHFIVENLISMREKFPRIIIYGNSINDVSRIYTLLRNENPDGQHFVDMYHAQTPEKTKKKIVESLRDPDSTTRIFIATSALGMGINIQGFQTVILYGPPKDFVELVQAIGRVGRDGSPAVAMLFYNSFHLRRSSSEMKDIYLKANCRRIYLMGQFLSEDEMTKLKVEECNKHTCCDICSELCKCGNCRVAEIEQIVTDINKIDFEHDDDDWSDSSLESNCEDGIETDNF